MRRGSRVRHYRGVCRSELQARHLDRWRREDPPTRNIPVLCTKPVEVVSIACDDWIIIACLSDGLAKVYNIDR